MISWLSKLNYRDQIAEKQKKWLRKEIKKDPEKYSYFKDKEKFDRFCKDMAEIYIKHNVNFVSKWDRFYFVHKGVWRKFEADKDLAIDMNVLDAHINR